MGIHFWGQIRHTPQKIPGRTALRDVKFELLKQVLQKRYEFEILTF